ncbi:hypothetical protein [Serratia symbiotica]|uniref:hypothetical protein n=1 Tax=Serratia symbiotica TaxID=138074 RepID=UPI0033139107
MVFGKVAGEHAARWALESGPANSSVLEAKGRDVETRLSNLMKQEGNENWLKIRDEMGLSMEEGCGIYRTPESDAKNHR